MTLDRIRNNINDERGSFVKVIYNGGRNKKEEYEGIVTDTYSYIFTVKLSDDSIKSFSYSDVLTNTVELYFDKKV